MSAAIPIGLSLPADPSGGTSHAPTRLQFEFVVGGSTHCLRLALDLTQRTQARIASAAVRGAFHEPEVARFLFSVLEPGDTHVEVGAHVGVGALLAAAAVGPDGLVLAFEAERANHRRVLDHVAANGFGQVEACNEALLDQKGQARLLLDAGDDARHALATGAVARPAMVQPVRATTLDARLPALRQRRVRVIRFDCSGAELLAIRGGAEALRVLEVPYLLVRVDPEALEAMGASELGLRAELRERGYDGYWLRPDPYGLVPFEPRVEVGRDGPFHAVFARGAVL